MDAVKQGEQVPNGSRGLVVRLLSSSAASNLGDGLRISAFALMTASVTDDPRLVGAVAAAGSVPALILGVPLGTVIDHLPRLRVLATVEFARALTYLALGTLVLTSTASIPVLMIAAALIGLCELLYDAGATTVLPALVRPSGLGRANVALRLAQEIGNGTLGPALGAVLYGYVSASPLFTAAGLFLLAGALVIPVARREEVPVRRASAPRVRMEVLTSAMMQGIAEVARNAALRLLLVVLCIWNVLGWMPEGILVLWLRQSLHTADWTYGVLLADTSLGVIIGGVVGLWLPRWRISRLLAGSLVAYGCSFALPAVVPSFPLACIAFFVQGLPLITLGAATTTLRQTSVPRRLLGRASTSITVGVSLSSSIGMALGGVLAGASSPNAVMLTSGAGLVTLGIVAFFLFRSLDTTTRGTSI